MAAALTLLPAMLGFAGRAIDRLHVPRLAASRGRLRRRTGFWFRWSRMVQRRAWLDWALALLVLLVTLAIPLFSMRLAFTDAGNDPTSLTTRQAYDLLAQGFGPGFNGPLVVAAAMDGRPPTPAMDQADQRRCGPTPGIAFAAPVEVNADRTAAVIIAYPDHRAPGGPDPQLVAACEPTVDPRGDRRHRRCRSLVGGETAAGVDAANYLSGRLFWVIGAVIVLAFLLLMAVFRSVVIPIKAAIMNLLSVGAAYGVIVAVFQWGWWRLDHRHRPHRAHRPVDPADDVHHPLRPLDGLRGLPPEPDPRGVAAHRRTTRRPWPTAWPDRPGDHRGGRHHGLRLRVVRDRTTRCGC